MNKVVFDTNILISGMAFPESLPAILLDLARNGTVNAYTSPFIISEFKKVLVLKFDYSLEQAEFFVAEITAFCQIVKPARKFDLINECRADNQILDCAFCAQADYLVSGDKKHILPIGQINGTQIVSARQFVDILKP